MIKNIWKTFFTDTFKQIEGESKEHLSSGRKISADVKIITIFIFVAISLIMIRYFNNILIIKNLIAGLGFEKTAKNFHNLILYSGNLRIFQLAFWTVWWLIWSFIIPVVIIKFFFKESLSDYGFRIRSAFKDYKIYILFIGIMLCLVIGFSFTDAFQIKYPFYKLSSGEKLWPFFWIWQALYFIHICGVEFFFRGFLLHGLKYRMGYYSVFIMVIPYCMIHFTKPLPETIGAIAAGVILGSLSLKTGSIWPGVVIHYSAAISMDLAALWQG